MIRVTHNSSCEHSSLQWVLHQCGQYFASIGGLGLGVSGVDMIEHGHDQEGELFGCLSTPSASIGIAEGICGSICGLHAKEDGG